MDNSKERRQYVRVNDEFNVRLAQRKKQKEFVDLEIDIAKSVNVSANGILVNIKNKIGIGDLVRVTFLKPNSFDFFEGMWKIIRIEEDFDGSKESYALAISFFDLSDAELKKLDYYITLLEE